MNKVFNNVVNNGLATSAVMMVDPPGRLGLNTDDMIMRALVNGSMQTLSEHIVMYFQEGKMSMDVWELVDDVAFNTIVFALIERFQLYNVILPFVQSLPLPDLAKQVLLSGVLAVASRTAFESLELIPEVKFNYLWRKLLHPSEWIKPLVGQE